MRIFLSYRRDDTAGWSQALSNALQKRFGRDHVFIDVEHIRNFDNFREKIFATIDHCDIFLAVIGPRWASITDQASGERRLNDPQDYVRLEIARALERRIRILAVLVDGAQRPSAAELPDDLKDLLRPDAHTLAADRWNADVAELLRRIDTRSSSRRVVLAALAAVVAGALSGSWGTMVVNRLLSLKVTPPSCPGNPSSGYGYASYGYKGAVGGTLL